MKSLTMLMHFPYDPTQQTDGDGDGYGDNKNGNLGDQFPEDPTKHADSDRDGIDDSTDVFPFDPTQTKIEMVMDLEIIHSE